jgi:hypothetical protein
MDQMESLEGRLSLWTGYFFGAIVNSESILLKTGWQLRICRLDNGIFTAATSEQASPSEVINIKDAQFKGVLV